MWEHRVAGEQRSTTRPAKRRFVIGCWLVLLLLLTGCANRPDVYQGQHREPAGEIWGPHTVGQTFTATTSGLYRIDVFLATYARRNTGEVVFHLRRRPDDQADLVTIPFDAANVADNAYRSFTFPPLQDSAGQRYYFFFEAPHAQPGNAITVWYNPTDAYGGGTALLDGVPQPGDLHFRTYSRYAPDAMLRDALRGLRRHWATALLALLLFLTPGYALLSLLAPDAQFDLPQRLLLSAGLTVAAAPLLMLYTSLVGVRLGKGGVVLVVGLSTGYWVLGIGYWVLRTVHESLIPNTRYPIPNTQPPTPNQLSLLALIAILSVATRLLLIQNLVAPMWGDSVHHTMIVQLLVDHGGLFDSWAPYAPLRTFTYHFGFHSLVALFHWLTGVPVLTSVLVVGQVLNALAALMAYPLVRRLGGGPWAGLIAVALASFWSPMPNAYVNWGRYTQLTGMTVLPVAAVLTIEVLDADRWRWRRGMLAAIALAGLALGHYLVVALYGTFLLIWLLVQAYRNWRAGHPLWRPWVWSLGVGLLAGLLLTPWWVRLWQGVLLRMLATRVRGGARARFFRSGYNAARDFLTYVPTYLPLLAALSLLWSLMRWRVGRSSRVMHASLVLAGWVALLGLLANPHVIGLPGTGVVHNFFVIIALYLPLSVLASYGLGDLVATLSARVRGSSLLLGGLILAAALVGAGRRFGDLDYRYRLVTAEDLQAMRWIQEHTSSDAKFLVNGFFSFGGNLLVGSDAGWWIPYLAHRRNTVPPASYTLERRQDPAYPAKLKAFYRTLMTHPLDSPEALQLLAAEGVTHVYIGAVGGELLDPRELVRSSHYRIVYQQGGVWIFEVVPKPQIP